jgi:uncharacterized membrane protein
MTHWALDIDRQTDWDLWCWVCLLAAGVLVFHWVVGRLTGARGSWASAGLCWVPVGITALLLSVPALRLPLIGVVWTTLLLLIVSYSQYIELRSKLSSRKIAILLSLRAVALVLAVPMLFEPVLRFTTRKDPDRPLMLIVDASGSMSVPDVQNGPTRMQSVSQALNGPWKAMTDRFRPQILVFSASSDQSVARPQQLAAISPDGQSTDIVSAVAKALATIKRDDAEIVLFSDGIDNASADVVAAIRASRRPVHTVLVGSESAQPSALVNVAVDRVEPGDEWTVRSAATIKATIKSASLGGRVVDVNFAEVDEQGRPTGSPIQNKLVLEPSPGGQEVSFEFTPTRTGVHRMAVWVDPVAGERSSADNKRIFQQLATDARVRVLYVEGRARPEFRELSRALARDATVESATLLRVAGDRFSAGGAIDGKPVNALPVDAEAWRAFDVIIIGDLDSSFLNPQQMLAIEKAVSEGSGLIMLGGQSSFGPGGYQQTPIEKLLPVTVGGRDAGQEKTEFVPKITPAGEAHPALIGLASWFVGKSDERGLYPLLGNVVVKAPKQGADVLLTHPERRGPDDQPQIVLAVQRYGKGRSAAFTADTTYRWYLPMRALGQQSPYTIFWGQLVRWVAGADVKDRGTKPGVETLVDKSIFALGESVRVRALVRDQKGDATRFAQVSIKLKRVGDNGSKPGADAPAVPLSALPARDGMYQSTLTNLEKGDWTGEVVASKDGQEIGRQTIGFSVIPPADEMLKLAADPRLMQQIATETGGYAYRLAQLPQLIDTLSRKGGEQALIQQRSVPLHSAPRSVLAMIGLYPAWAQRFDLPMQTLIVVVLLLGEWVMRRRWQLL